MAPYLSSQAPVDPPVPVPTRLVVSHSRAQQCPMCRAACHGGAGDCGTNLAMVGIIMTQFSRQYEERQKEVCMYSIGYFSQ